MPACLILGLERGDVHISPYLPTSYKDAGSGGKSRLVPKNLYLPLFHTTSCPSAEWLCHTLFSMPSCEVGWQLTTEKGAAGDMRGKKNKLLGGIPHCSELKLHHGSHLRPLGDLSGLAICSPQAWLSQLYPRLSP